MDQCLLILALETEESRSLAYPLYPLPEAERISENEYVHSLKVHALTLSTMKVDSA